MADGRGVSKTRHHGSALSVRCYVGMADSYCPGNVVAMDSERVGLGPGTVS